MSDDHLIIEKEADILDVLLRPGKVKKTKRRSEKKKARAASLSKIVKSTREKRERRKRLLEGLCTHCGKRPPLEGHRRCDECRENALQRRIDSRFRKKITGADDDRS